MDDRLLSLIATVGLLILCLVGIAVYQYRARKTQPEEEDFRPPSLPECVVCRLRASEYAPITGVSWMDKLPLLNRLYSLAPRHIIVDNVEGDLCYCRLHKKTAVAELAREHAQLRSELAAFNSMQEARIAVLDGGEILQRLLQQHREHLRALKISAETPMPRLPAHDNGIITTVVSSPSMVPEEDA
jgi:hypothetical protein